MSTITESRIYPIKEKIFTLENIREIAIIICQAGLEEVDNLNAQTIFTIKCFDNTVYTSNDISIINMDSVISKKRIESIQLEVTGERKITFFLRHGVPIGTLAENNSYMSIAGTDNFWVNGLLGKINEQLANIENQETFVHKWSKPIKWLFMLSTFFLWCRFEDWYYRNTKGYVQVWKAIVINHNWNYLFELIFFGCGGGFLLIIMIYSEFDKLFPSIELQTGPEHFKLEKHKRTLYLFYITVLVIPLLISLLFEFLH
jgi:hypothetical protein